ncbi:MAG: hypothetical protein RBU37_11610 [Myxococcota bacterium]|nr:hypothetical protein [Myxococcota bacterium]
MRRSTNYQPFLTLLCAVLLTSSIWGCADESERCASLRRSIEAKERLLPRACQSHMDCVVVATRPDHFVAASSNVDDPELAASVQSYGSECEQSEPIANVFEAKCLIYGTEANGLCTLMYGDSIIDTDDFEVPAPACDCVEHADCQANELCQGECYCAPPCLAACRQAQSCGESSLASLGLGTDLQTCIAVCEVNHFNAEIQTRARCLAESDCESISDCVVSDTP